MIEGFSDAVDIAVKIVGGLAVGTWTYHNYLRERRGYPHAKIENIVEIVPVDENKKLLRISVVVKNVGAGLLRIERLCVCVQQVLPMPLQVARYLQTKMLSDAARAKMDWEVLCAECMDFTSGEFELEPGEEDLKPFDVLVASDVKVALVYSYVENSQKAGREIGWPAYTLLRLV